MNQLWRRCDIQSKASLVFSRITFSPVTTAYFVVAVVHCILQSIIQTQAFAVNAAAVDQLWSSIQQGDLTAEAAGFAVFGDDLRICYTLPNTVSAASCQVIWPNNQSYPTPVAAAAETSSISATPSIISVATQSPPTSTLDANAYTFSTSVANYSVSTAALSTPVSISSVNSTATLPASHASSTLDVTNIPTPSPILSDSLPVFSGLGIPPRLSTASKNPGKQSNGNDGNSNDLNNGYNKIVLSSYGRRGVAENDPPLAPTCVQTLIWPVQQLNNTKREDIALIGFQIWVLSMSIVALLNESIPHVVAALVTHVLVTVWTIFQVFQTETFQQSFIKLTTNGACPKNLLGSFWEERRVAEITSAILNGVTFVITAGLTYKLMKTYGWQTFKRVGASLTINRIYQLVLLLSIVIQLGLFFLVSAAALWIDQLYNGPIGRFASLAELYKGGIIVMFGLLFPWLYLGWFFVRREGRTFALAFLVLDLFFISLWASMFKSTSFRWTFVLWPFFAFMTVAAGALLVLTFTLGIICRFNFGKGLPRYLNAQEHPDDDDFIPVISEKGGFDSDPEKVEFPSSNGRRPVPTFSAAFGKGSEALRPTQMQFGRMQGSVPGSNSSTSVGSVKPDGHLERMDSNGSQMSHNSDSSTDSRRTDVGKRWVIE